MSRSPRNLPSLPQNLVDAAIRVALDEDLGLAGDITTNATVAAGATANAVIAARKPGVVAGLALAEAAFRRARNQAIRRSRQDARPLAPITHAQEQTSDPAERKR